MRGRERFVLLGRGPDQGRSAGAAAAAGVGLGAAVAAAAVVVDPDAAAGGDPGEEGVGVDRGLGRVLAVTEIYRRWS